MKATSPPLNAKPRSEEDAAQDVEHRKQTTALVGALYHLASTEAPAHYVDAVEYALNELHAAQAARILERNKST